MHPETLFCIRDSKHNRDIHTLIHEGDTGTDLYQIVSTMPSWYERRLREHLRKLKILPPFLGVTTYLPQGRTRGMLLEKNSQLKR
jgi:hypothetical protein